MVLMPSNSHDFRELAVRVCDKCTSSGMSLEDCVVDVAEELDLTPEEIRRLVEKSNTEMSLRHLRSEDRKAVFSLAKTDNVLERTHSADNDEHDGDDEDDEIEKTSSLMPDSRRSKRDLVVMRHEKTASRTERVVDATEFNVIRQAYDDAMIKKADLATRIQEDLDWLADWSAGHSDERFSKLAEDLLGTVGSPAIPLIMHMSKASGRRMIEKTAEDFSHAYDEGDVPLMKAASACNNMLLLERHSRQVERLDNALSACRDAMGRMSSWALSPR